MSNKTRRFIGNSWGFDFEPLSAIGKDHCHVPSCALLRVPMDLESTNSGTNRFDRENVDSEDDGYRLIRR